MWSSIVQLDLFYTGMVVVCGLLQLCCFHSLNSFVPCVCTFTYLSLSSWLTMNCSLLQEAWQCHTCLSHTWTTSIYRNTLSISEHTRVRLSLSETSVRQTRVNDTHVQIHTYIHTYIPTIIPNVWAFCCDQCGAHSGLPQLMHMYIHVWLCDYDKWSNGR